MQTRAWVISLVVGGLENLRPPHGPCPPYPPSSEHLLSDFDAALTDNQSYNALVTALRAPTEHGNALLGQWRALERVTVCPQRIGVIAAAALVLTSLDRGSR